MNAVLPFDGFLELLRSKGYGVGLNEHFALANLLDHWDRTHAEEFGDAVAALVARNDEEVQGIRRLFVEVYLAPRPAPPSIGPAPVRPTVVQRWAWPLASVAAAAVIAAVLWRMYPTPAPVPVPRPETETVVVPPPTAPALVVAPVSLPPPPAPPLPDPPQRLERRLVVAIVSVAFLGVLALFWSLKTRQTTRTWLRDTWASALAALPGPYHFTLVLRDPPARLPRADVEDAATILGRTFTPDAQARQLDVQRSVRMTLRHGMLPHLVFKPRRTAQPILVFQDISQDMQIWRSKVDIFLADLIRQGVPLERWYFDGDPRRVTDRPFRAALLFETVTRRRPTSPVLFISAGGGIESSLATGDFGWLRALRAVLRKSWLTPVTDLRLWPETFQRETLGLDVWPMTRAGLSRMAKDLAGLEGEPADRLRSSLRARGSVSADDIERVKRLASVVPHPTTELLEVLRKRFAPDVSDAVVVHLLPHAGGPATPVVRLSDEEVKRCLEAMRRETPHLEAAVRRTVIGVLSDSQPTPGSTAHQRWQLSVALQQLQLADIEKSDASAPVAAIRALGASPIWEEVRVATQRLPANAELAKQIEAAMGARRGDTTQPPDAAAVAHEPQPWSWPGVREIVPASIAATLLFVAGQLLNVFPATALEHVRDAYRLNYVDRGQPGQSALLLQVQGDPSTLPAAVDILQDARVFRPGVNVAAAGTSVPLASADTGHYYQARATLAGGNLAVSNAVWVPSDTAVIVSIDASPWANVSLQSDQATVAEQATPFSASLVPGRYRLHFDNNGVTPPMDQTIDVTPANRVFRFTMPGFDPLGKAAELTRTR
jgi:hypothetical protein